MKRKNRVYFDIEIKKDMIDNQAQSSAELGTVGIDGNETVYKLIERKKR